MSEQAPNQSEQLTLDGELARQSDEARLHESMISRIESSEDLIHMREALTGLDDVQVNEKVEEYIINKLLGVDGVAENGKELVDRFGSNVGEDMKSLVIDYATMPEEEFSSKIAALKKSEDAKKAVEATEQSTDSFAESITRATEDDIPKSAIAMMAHEAQTISSKPSSSSTEEYQPKHLDESKPQTDNTDYSGKHLREDVPEGEDNTSELEASTEKLPVADRIHNRWNKIKAGVYALPVRLKAAVGEMKGTEGPEEQKKWIKRGMIGAVAVASAGVLAVVSNRHGIDFDPGIFDGDGIDLNPFNNDIEPTAVEGGPELTPDIDPPAPELVSVNVDVGEGTSYIARDQLGINFDTVQQWNEFNAETNPLFENVDGMYHDAVSGEWRIANPGELNVPQDVLNKMTEIAKKIKEK